MTKNAQNLLHAIKNNQFIYHLTDIDKSVIDNELIIDSYFDELILEGYYTNYNKEYVKNQMDRIYKIIYIVR